MCACVCACLPIADVLEHKKEELIQVRLASVQHSLTLSREFVNVLHVRPKAQKKRGLSLDLFETPEKDTGQ